MLVEIRSVYAAAQNIAYAHTSTDLRGPWLQSFSVKSFIVFISEHTSLAFKLTFYL